MVPRTHRIRKEHSTGGLKKSAGHVVWSLYKFSRDMSGSCSTNVVEEYKRGPLLKEAHYFNICLQGCLTANNIVKRISPLHGTEG